MKSFGGFILSLVSLIILHQSNCSSRLPEEDSKSVFRAFSDGGLDVMCNVLDQIRRVTKDSERIQARLENVFTQRLRYSPQLTDFEDGILPLDPELVEETEKMMNTVLYELYDEWDDLMEPLKRAFSLEDAESYNQFNLLLMNGEHRSSEIPFGDRSPNETIMNIIEGLNQFPNVFAATGHVVNRVTRKIQQGDIHGVDRKKLQAKIVEKFAKASENYRFL